MEYLLLLAALAVFIIGIMIREAMRAKAAQKAFVDSLYQNYGNPPERKYSPEAWAHVTGFYERHRPRRPIDDITWNDLNMDDLFRRMNYTCSATGEEYLYYMLRNADSSVETLKSLEEVVSWFADHADERVRVQFWMSRVGYTGKYSLYDYIENLNFLGERRNLRHHLANALYLPFLALAPFQLAVAVFGIAALSVYQIVTYFRDKAEIEPYFVSFAYVFRLMEACEKICAEDLPACAEQTERMRRHIGNLRGIRRGAFWVFNAQQSKSSGNPLEAVMDYARMVFHVDLIIFNRMLRELQGHPEDVDGLIASAGYLEAAISIGAFRASLRNGWCVPTFENGGQTRIWIEEGYHPLLEEPVKNSIRAERGVLLTGSNASGKSTFLKTVALNAIFAQTIHTCTADSYTAPLFAIYSSMALRDDLNGGESYYIVEIKALKRILDAAREGRMLCFVDEVLRGTNTVERIAASAQILKSLTSNGSLCFAATHDIELAELLKETYDNYHFEEEIKEGDIFFPYRLLPGKTSTRNAIRLLEIMGYEPEIIGQAFERAKSFMETGVWRA